MGSITTTEFIEEVMRLQQQSAPWDNSIIRMATIDPNYQGIGLPAVRFDGEMGITISGYHYLSTFTPQPGDRVIMIRISTSWLIIGSASASSRAYHVVDNYPVASSDGDLIRFDQGGWWEFNGATGAWEPMRPWGVAWGALASQSLTSNSSNYTATGNSDFVFLGFKCRADRTYRIHLSATFILSATGAWTITATVDGTDVGRFFTIADAWPFGDHRSSEVLWMPPSTDSVDVRVKHTEISGTATFSYVGTSQLPRQFWIEDVGPRTPFV